VDRKRWTTSKQRNARNRSWIVKATLNPGLGLGPCVARQLAMQQEKVQKKPRRQVSDCTRGWQMQASHQRRKAGHCFPVSEWKGRPVRGGARVQVMVWWNEAGSIRSRHLIHFTTRRALPRVHPRQGVLPWRRECLLRTSAFPA
jgi:hypothetical protein